MSRTRPAPDFSNLSSPRPCTRCAGAGVTHSQWSKDHGHEGPAGKRCYKCEGRGRFPALDVAAVLAEVFTKRGAKKRFRKSYTSPPDWSDTTRARAYYVWRIARFHGGADVTMPMTAETIIDGDPFRPELEAIAEVVARLVFGTDMAAAYRWSGVLRGEVEIPAGLPATAYPCGPVADALKPEFELLELI